MRIDPQTLNLRVFPFEGEPLFGYVGRLARLHGKASIRAFLTDYAPELSQTQVWRGEAQGSIARLVDLPEDVFLASTFAPIKTAAGPSTVRPSGRAIGPPGRPGSARIAWPKIARPSQGGPNFRADSAILVGSRRRARLRGPRQSNSSTPLTPTTRRRRGSRLRAGTSTPTPPAFLSRWRGSGDDEEVALSTLPWRAARLRRPAFRFRAETAARHAARPCASGVPGRRRFDRAAAALDPRGVRPLAEPLDRHGLRRAGFAYFQAGPEALARALDGVSMGLPRAARCPAPSRPMGRSTPGWRRAKPTRRSRSCSSSSRRSAGKNPGVGTPGPSARQD